MNYFTIEQTIEIDSGYVLLILRPDYGPELLPGSIRLPIAGSPSEYPEGSRIEIEAKVVKRPIDS